VRQIQHEVKRVFCASQITAGRLASDEKDYRFLKTLLPKRPGPLGVGANVGPTRCDVRRAQVRVIGIEPVRYTLALLASNARDFPPDNLSLLNVAMSDRGAVANSIFPAFTVSIPSGTNH
jgi:hypothetical protein